MPPTDSKFFIDDIKIPDKSGTPILCDFYFFWRIQLLYSTASVSGDTASVKWFWMILPAREKDSVNWQDSKEDSI